MREFAFVNIGIKISSPFNTSMFGSKHCEICGMDVDKEMSTKRFGKHFCSDEHANQFGAKIAEVEKREEEYRKSHPDRGCCS